MAELQNISWPDWETVRLIGRGSFGAVYEIQRNLFGRVEKAALKVISIPQNASDIEEMYSDGYDEESITSTFQSYLQNIVTEYSLMREMNGSANVVNCDDVRYVQHDNGIGWDIFIKMELLTPLTKALPGQIPEETAVKIARDLCAALELCRKHNIVHRDIKPQNIFVSSNGDYKLGDFGVAKTVEKTTGGTKIGTYKYMAPEVYHNRPYGAAADIYSLGLVLYWLLNQRRMPFLPLPPEKLTAGAEEQARYRRLSGEALPAPKNGSGELKRIVLKACAYDPRDRYASAEEMRKELEALGQSAPIPEKIAVIPTTPAAEAVPEEDATVGMFSQVKTPATEPKKAAVIPTPPAAEADRQKQAEADEDLTVSMFHKAAPQDKSRAAGEEAARRKAEQEAQERLLREQAVREAQAHLQEAQAQLSTEPADKTPRNKKKPLIIAAVITSIIAIALIIGYFTVHIWTDATCINPVECKICGETKGAALEHKWRAATCTTPATCKICGKTKGVVSEHSWRVANCTTPATCTGCGKTDGAALGHKWVGATCVSPPRCSFCGKIEGTASGHLWKKATCTTPATCVTCGETVGSVSGHSWNAGVCSRCGNDRGPVAETVSVGGAHAVGVKSDGTVVAVGNNDFGQCEVDSWRKTVAISAGGYHTVGLRSDGVVVAVGSNSHGQCDVGLWTDIVAISAGYSHTVGLKSDGTVVAVGNNGVSQCYVDQWRDIVAISAGRSYTVGLKADGTLVAVGIFDYELSGWTDLVAVSAGDIDTIGLKADGTVVADWYNWNNVVSGWQDLVAVSAGDRYIVGLKADGTVVAVGDNYGSYKLSGWTDIVAISTGGDYIVGLKADGTMMVEGNGQYDLWELLNWKDIKLPK